MSLVKSIGNKKVNFDELKPGSLLIPPGPHARLVELVSFEHIEKTFLLSVI